MFSPATGKALDPAALTSRHGLLPCQTLEIADGNVGHGAFAHRDFADGQAGIPDTAAEQSHVRHQRLHKAVPGAAQHLVLFRLLHSSGGIFSRINDNIAGDPFDNKHGVAAHEQILRLPLVLPVARFRVGKILNEILRLIFKRPSRAATH